MFTRVLAVVALGLGAVLGVIAILGAPGTALGGVVFGSLVGVGAVLSVRAAATGAAVARARAGRRGGLICGGVATGGWLVLVGLALLLGPTSVAVVSVTAATAVAVWLWRRPDPWQAVRTNPLLGVRDRLMRAAQHTAPPVPVITGPPAPMPWSVPIPADLSIPELCTAWQHTYFVLQELPAGASRSEIVRVRERLLDEIERRDPEGFTRWLDLGARAGSDPGRYLAGDR